MSFLSIEFALLFVAFFALYWLFVRAPRVQNLLLLAAGYALAASFDWRFALIMGAFATAVWALGHWVAEEHGATGRLRAAALLTLLPLAVFKYFDFFREQAQALLHGLGLEVLLPALPLLLPIGVSFYSFTAVSYLVGVQRREVALASLPQTMLLLAFFPVLVAGPICRASALLPQIRARRRCVGNADRIAALVVLAIVKKWALAGYLGNVWVDPLFADPDQYHALELLCGLYAYALQIYFDFSGYSDLAVALALMLGFSVPQNFDAPYMARNLRAFWQRWHISLSTWIRDYIYIPLGGSRQGFWRTQAAVVVAMLLSGLWHGAGGHFVVWGALHAAGVVALNAMRRVAPGLHLGRLSAQWLTFQYVALAWLFFRAADTSAALDYLQAMQRNVQAPALRLPVFGMLAVLLGLLWTQGWWARWPQRLQGWLAATPVWLKPLGLALGLALVVLCAPSGIPGFIYAQF